jgi:hypothetical protein
LSGVGRRSARASSAGTKLDCRAAVEEWQTRCAQNALSERTCGFESHPPHLIMRVNAEYAEALDLLAGGLNDRQVARATGIPRSTIRDWRARPRDERRVASFPVCPSCGIAHHDLARLPRASYAYLLGMYLGDGTIDRYPRTWRLRISLDCAWPGIARECRESMLEVFPRNKIHRYQPDPDSRCWVLSVYSTRLVCLFPQHGPGAKHLRPIKLANECSRHIDRETRLRAPP